MFRLKEMPRIRAMDYIHCSAPTFKAAQDSPTDALVVRAAIFQTVNDVPYLLILKRAATDSMPNRWEPPGGGVDDRNDETIHQATVREVKEETGLTAAWLIQEVGQGQRWTQRRRDGSTIKWLAITFLVEAEEIELIQRGEPAQGVQPDPDSLHQGPATSPDHAGPDLGKIPVQLAPAEHQHFLWVSKDEVQAGQGASERLEFTNEEVRQSMLQAFDLQLRVLEARKQL